MNKQPTTVFVQVDDIHGSYLLIPLTQGQFAKIDKSDLDLVNRCKWQAAKRADGKGFYATSRFGKMHRIILSISDSRIVDHKDGDGLNNRRYNIRAGNQSLNSVNRRTTQSKYLRGVYKDGNCWFSKIKINKKNVYLGSFKTEQEAHNAFMNVAKKIHGEWVPQLQ